MTMQKIRQHLSLDPVLKELIDSMGPLVYPVSSGLFQDLLRSIVGQQLSARAASTIYSRFLGLFEKGMPEAESILLLDEGIMRKAGLSRQKAAYLKNVAAFFREEKIEHRDLHELDDEEVIQYLTRIKGVGRWTVEMILMFTLKRPDVFPLDDLGIRKAIVRQYNLSENGRELRARLVQVAEPWRPYRSHACWYLWKSLDATGSEVV